MPTPDERMAEHRRRYLRRLGALRATVRAPGGRNHLRALRRAAGSPVPRNPRRRPALVLLVAFALVLLVLGCAERVAGSPLPGGIHG